jgi:hypothetical protein
MVEVGLGVNSNTPLGIVALCAALGGCAGSDTHLRMLENSNALANSLNCLPSKALQTLLARLYVDLPFVLLLPFAGI